MRKKCSKCQLVKDETEFYRITRHKDKRRAYCKDCRRELSKGYMHEYRKRRKALGLSARGNSRGATRKAAVMAAYGGVCCRCGFSDVRALTIHHVNGNGVRHRGKGRRSGEALYRWLYREGFPRNRGLVILCANCHMINDSTSKSPPSGHA